MGVQDDKSWRKINFEAAVNYYVLELLHQWDLDISYGYWVGDEVGGVYAYGDHLFINLLDIIYCVENGVTEKEYTEWQDYCTWAGEFNQNTPNFKAWHRGCLRHNKETIEKFNRMKAELDECIKAAEQLF